MMMGVWEVWWGWPSPFPETHLGEVKESKHFEVEGEGWIWMIHWFLMAFIQSYETLGGVWTKRLLEETFLFWILLILLILLALSSQKNNQKTSQKKLVVSVSGLQVFCEGSDTLHPESIWCFWKIVVTKSRCLWNPSGECWLISNCDHI